MRILIQFACGRYALPCRVLAIVTLVVERCGVALVVRGDNAGSQNSTITTTVVDLRDGVSLREVLVGVIDIVNYAEVGLQDSFLVFKLGFEFETVGNRWASRGYVFSQ